MANESDVFNAVRQLTNWIKETLITKALPALEDFVKPENSNSFGSDEIICRIKNALVAFWADLAKEMVHNKRKDANPYYLLLSRLSQEWSKGVIESIFSMYSERLFLKGLKKSATIGPAESEIIRISAASSLVYQMLAKRLLSRFVQSQVEGVMPQIRLYAKGPVHGEQPIMVSPIWKDIYSRFEEMTLQIRSTYKEEVVKSRTGTPTKEVSRAKTVAAPRNNQKGESKDFDNILVTLDKLFDERLIFMTPSIELKLTAAMNVVTKCILKVTSHANIRTLLK